MLVELSVKNFALIDDLVLHLEAGLSVLTGETGAGKSIIIDTLGAAIGSRISPDVIRTGEQAAIVDAVFAIDDNKPARQMLCAQGYAEENDTSVVLSRRIAPGGSSCRINGRPVTQRVLQEFTRHLVDIHGQHEHQVLIHEENHLEFLDTFGGNFLTVVRARYQAAWEEFRRVGRELAALRTDARDRAQRIDVLQYQVDEISAAEPAVDEEEALLAERKRLNSVEKLREIAFAAHTLLDAEGGDDGAAAALEQVADYMQELAVMDTEMAVMAEEINTAAGAAREAQRALSAYIDELENDPQRLEQIEERLDVLSRLKRKYGDTVADVLCYRDSAAAELAALLNADEDEQDLQKALDQARTAAGAAAGALSEARRQAAEKLAEQLETILPSLGMPHARFEVKITCTPDDGGVVAADGTAVRATSRGVDEVVFLLSTNVGEEPRPLAKVASGGELSRVMLAFKSLLTSGSDIGTLVFDEVDAGIGGQTALQVGKRLAELANHSQVLCVTHLPQIAGIADHHIHVEKLAAKGRTAIRVRTLGSDERTEELARMFGAGGDDTAAKNHARDMLKKAKNTRQQPKAP